MTPSSRQQSQQGGLNVLWTQRFRKARRRTVPATKQEADGGCYGSGGGHWRCALRDGQCHHLEQIDGVACGGLRGGGLYGLTGRRRRPQQIGPEGRGGM